MYIWICFHCSYKRSLDVILKVYLLKNGSSIQKSSHTFSESQMKLQLELIVELCQTFLYYFFDQSNSSPNSITNYYQECKGVLLKWETFFSKCESILNSTSTWMDKWSFVQNIQLWKKWSHYFCHCTACTKPPKMSFLFAIKKTFLEV